MRLEETPMWYSAVGCIVTLTLSFLAAPLAADAQPSAKVARIGYLSLAKAVPLEEAFRHRPRRQPRATRREYHGAHPHERGVSRETARAAERDDRQPGACGRTVECA